MSSPSITLQSASKISDVELRLFESIPGNNVLLKNDAPKFTIVAATKEFAIIAGKKKEQLIGKGLFDLFPSNPLDKNDTGEGILRWALNQVIETGKTVSLPVQRYDVANEEGLYKEKYWNATNTPFCDENNEVCYIIHSTTDITFQVQYQQRSAETKLLQQAHNLYLQASFGIAILQGPSLKVELANEHIIEMWGKGADVIDKPIIELLPEIESQGLIDLMKQVINTSVAHRGYETAVTLKRNGKDEVRYFNFVYQPYYAEDKLKPVGIIIFANDVTDRVRVRKQLEEKEQSLKLVIEVGELGVYRTDLSQTDLTRSKVICSKRLNEWFGFSHSEITLADVLSRIHKDDQQLLTENIKSTMQGGNPRHDFTYRVSDLKSNSFRHLRSIGEMKFENGIPVSISGILQDVTSQVHATNNLRESEQRFGAAIDAIEGILWTNNAVGQMQGEQPGWASLTGQKYSEYQGFGWAHAVHPADAQPTIDAWNEAVKDRKTFVFEHRVKMKNGKYGTFSVRAIPLMNDDGSIREWVGVHTNITEQRKAEQTIRESEERFRTLADHSPMIVYIMEPDADAKMSYFNTTWLNYTGQTFSEALGRAWDGIIHPEDVPRVLDIYVTAFKKRESYTLPAIRVRRHDGEYRWHLFKANPRYLLNGDFMGYVGVGIDIHEQKLSEEAIKRNEAELQKKVDERTAELIEQKSLLDNIMSNSSNGISVTEMIRDKNNQVIDASTILANDAAIRFTGLPKDVYLGTTASELDPNILESPYGQACLNTLKTGEPAIIQYFLEVTGKWLELTISKMDDDHLIHIFTDVTQIKEAQLQLEKTVEELRRSNANLEEFAYAASHDLKEPIRKIHFFSDRLKKSMRDRMLEEELNSFSRMEVASRRMGDLIDDLLSYSQVSMRPRKFEEVNLNQVIALILEDLDLEIEEKKANIEVDELFTIKGHHRQLQQAFQNLIGNALKYNNPEVPLEIKIQQEKITGKNSGFILTPAEQVQEFYCIKVLDNGIGFDQIEADRIFNVFTRLHGNTEYRGTGVGLSIVRKVIENHNGYVRAVSEPGKGATFIILLPV